MESKSIGRNFNKTNIFFTAMAVQNVSDRDFSQIHLFFFYRGIAIRSWEI